MKIRMHQRRKKWPLYLRMMLILDLSIGLFNLESAHSLQDLLKAPKSLITKEFKDPG
jgi:hypothetical protein